MPVLHVEYNMEVQYAQPAVRSFFTIKCTPVNDQRQSLLQICTKIIPETSYTAGTDSFGNRQIYGCILSSHDRFLFHMKADVQTQDSSEIGKDFSLRAGIYRYPHGKCIPWSAAEEFLKELPLEHCASEFERCTVILHALHKRLSYVKNTTTVYTTAREAWEKGCGVCQDFAHIYITMLRMTGIPARYVCGFIIGEGESHAWVEAFCAGMWIALDPTQDSVISDQYIKLGHGRDAADCPINRGIILGGGAQTQSVCVKVAQQ